MCTVSFVPANNTAIFTFNRDEQPERLTPSYINQLTLEHKTIYFSKDIKAGGSWFTCDDAGNVALLFNGAFTSHTKQPSYKKSRGKVLLDIISAKEMLAEFSAVDLENIEPFSIILIDNKKLYRLVWDAVTKKIMPLNKNEHHIFSSATLYTAETQQLRKYWLDDYLKEHPVATPDLMYAFHAGYNITDTENGLVIKRNHAAHTLSISQLVLTGTQVALRHWDLKTEQYHQQTIQLK